MYQIKTNPLLDVLDNDKEVFDEIKMNYIDFLSKKNDADDLSLFIDKATEKAIVDTNIEHESISLDHKKIRVFARPSLLCKEEHDGGFVFSRSKTLNDRLYENRHKIKAAISATGRIENSKGVNFGTAWVVALGILVTNRHVANNIKYTHDQFTVNFKGEYGSIKKLIFNIKKENIFIIPGDADIAFIRVDKKNPEGVSLPTKINLASTFKKGQDVCVIGYPGKEQTNDKERRSLMDEIFDGEFKNGIYVNGIYNVKRISPGKIMNQKLTNPFHDGMFSHDCCTLAGNSGSVIFSYSTAEAVGLHYDGKYKIENYAVPASIVAETLKNI